MENNLLIIMCIDCIYNNILKNRENYITENNLQQTKNNY